MNEINNLPKQVPEPTHDFQIDIVGSVTKKRFLGEFTCTVATIKDQCMQAKHEATLNGEYGPYLPLGVQKINKMISYLRYTLVDVPKFWKKADMGYQLRDANVIEAVYDEVLAFEEAWLKEVWKEKDPQEEEESDESEQEEGSEEEKEED